MTFSSRRKYFDAEEQQKDRLAGKEGSRASDTYLSENSVQIWGRSPLPNIIRILCCLSWGLSGCARRYRQISPIYCVTVASNLMQSSQNFEAENLGRIHTVFPAMKREDISGSNFEVIHALSTGKEH